MFRRPRACRRCSVGAGGLIRRLTSTNTSISGARAAVMAPVRMDVNTTFIPTLKFTPQDVTAPSHELMLRAGMMRQTGPGLFVLLPLGLRTFNKLKSMIHTEMAAIGADEFAFPCLTKRELWDQSGRWEEAGAELMRLKDRKGGDYCLGPTHEEPFTALAGDNMVSWKQLPWRFYQLDRKFRDELRPRHGLVRAREFWMKDMYTFDRDEAGAELTYDLVTHAYHTLFTKLTLPFSVVNADAGLIGGSKSHEYHVASATVGDDQLVSCNCCGFAANVETVAGGADCTVCPECGVEGMHSHMGVEVGHTFYLGKKYSEAFNASFVDHDGSSKLAEMGCYGLGVTRIMQAAIEVYNDEDGIIWPACIAPFRINITVFNGNLSKKAAAAGTGEALVGHGYALYDRLQTSTLRGDVILDTSARSNGTKMADAALVGYPWQVVVGTRFDPNLFEVKRRGNSEPAMMMTYEELVAAIIAEEV
jgi:prolyl-tRNA synthetase